MQKITIDGRQLSYPGTGLALETAEFLHAFQDLGYGKSIAVFIPPEIDLSYYNLQQSDLHWITVPLKVPAWKHWLARAATIPEAIERLAWAKAVTSKQQELNLNAQHYIPYLYNYGERQKNVVMIPDLIYKLVRKEVLDPNRPWWWNLRYKLPLRSRVRDWEERQVLQAKQFVVHSEFVRNFVVETTGVCRDRLTLIPLAAPSWLTAEEYPEDASRIRKKYGLPDRFVLYVGGYGSRKNIPMLLRVCGQIQQIDPTFCCVFAGLTEELLQTIFGAEMRAELENPAVRAATIPIPSPNNRELAALYRLAEFTVYPSLSEGFGFPILEAAAAGKLCLSGDNSSLKEVQAYPQYRISSEEEESWRDRVLYFWQNREAAANAGRDCAKLANKYSWHRSAEQLWNLLVNSE